MGGVWDTPPESELVIKDLRAVSSVRVKVTTLMSSLGLWAPGTGMSRVLDRPSVDLVEKLRIGEEEEEEVLRDDSETERMSLPWCRGEREMSGALIPDDHSSDLLVHR